MVLAIQEGLGVVARRECRLIGLAAALAAALALAGCGRKSALDRPPDAAIVDPMFATQENPGPGHDADGKPVLPQVQKRRTPLDFLID
jgi:predicted small lipoprotein YifL